MRIVTSLLLLSLSTGTFAQSSSDPAVAVQHKPGFEAEREKANDLFLAQKPLEALPLYEDLSRQDPKIAVFAERYGAGLLAKEATLSEPAERLKVHLQAMEQFKRAQSLGDDSAYIRTVLDADAKTLTGSIVSGIPLTVGYSYRGKPEAQSVFHQAEAAFGRSDWANAAKLYTEASSLDPSWYDPILYAGDSFFRMKDIESAGSWFKRAIAIDPDRETAYRYWGDALFQAGDVSGARQQFVEAVVAEPYSRASVSELGQWASRTGHQLVRPAITRPEFTTRNGALVEDPVLVASNADGRACWIVYQKYRVAHGALTLNQPLVAGGIDANGVIHPSGYQHTIEEERAALRAMLADVEGKLKSGAITDAGLDPSIRNLRNLEAANFLGAWIAINASDAGIRSDYSQYRAHHRKHLADYINAVLIKP